ncbi:hypothetical protein [Salinibacterium sp. M195]|uniref:hypothetical protein n=1 Tax=Salinibacterium sp. M195 TaxID=2583374 RepID=UPI001C633B20|nr:hypothetical protein [Salinibacterium sp. M195]QYH34683.1 hypothetical protein FFT87_01255 [Salinibacterium sp. M195]
MTTEIPQPPKPRRTSEITLPMWAVVTGGIALVVLLVTVVVLSSIALIGLGVQQDLASRGAETDTSNASEQPSAVATESADAPDSTTIAEAVSYSGQGNQILPVELPDGPGALTAAEFVTSGGDKFEVTELDSNLEQIGNSLMYQTEDYTGTVLLNTWSSSGATAYLDIKTSGSWTINLNPASAIPVINWPFDISGSTDAVYVYNGPAGVVQADFTGKSNSIVSSFPPEGGIWESLVNEIGSYSGPIRWTDGPSIIEVTGDGPWTLVSQ